MLGYSLRRASIWLRVGMAVVPSPSTEKEAAQAAKRVAFQTSPLSQRRMRKAAAKTSPAPVGSTTLAGKASMWRQVPRTQMSAPLEPGGEATIWTRAGQGGCAGGGCPGGGCARAKE